MRWAWLRIDPLAFLALCALWIFCNPFFEVNQSAPIYLARAMADLDPQGMGQDMMFRLEGQSAFTLFTPALRWITDLAGTGVAPKIVSAAAVMTAFCAAYVFASAVATGRSRWLAVALMASMPAWYGDGYQLFSYSEAAATPRPFAEALVLFGLAALLRGHVLVALALTALACLLHPIMAMAGLGTIFISLSIADRRILAVAAALILAGALAGLMGVAPFDRVFARVDPEWSSTLRQHVPFLFPSQWSSYWIGRAGRIASLLIALSFVDAPARRLFVAVALTGLLGIAASALFGDRLGLLLALQAQGWRAAWLISSVGLAASAICFCALWPRGGVHRVVVCLLALTWMTTELGAPAFLLGFCAVAAFYALDPSELNVGPALQKALAAILAASLVLVVAFTQLPLWRTIASAPAGEAMEAISTVAFYPNFAPVAMIALALALSPLRMPQGRLGRAALSGALAATLAAACLQWDMRSAAARYFDAGKGAGDLASVLAQRPGEIFWIDGQREAWEWLRRPNWLSAIQGSSMVFSRDLAAEFRRRSTAAIDAGLEPRSFFETKAGTLCEPLSLKQEKIEKFCAAPDAPAWIVAPLADGAPLPADLKATEWTAPLTTLSACMRDGEPAWSQKRRYALIPCRG